MCSLLMVVPARSGSKGVPDKNILDLNGKPLFVHSLDYARRSRLSDSEILLSTDSAEYAEIAESYGYKVPFLRTSSAARDESTDLEFMLDAREKYATLLKQSFRYFAILRPTSPLRPAGLIEKSLEILEGEPQIDSVRAVTIASEHPYRSWFLRDGLLSPVVSEVQEPYNLPRQKLPKAYFQSGDIEVMRDATLAKGSVSGSMVAPIFVENDAVLDIDSPQDFIRARDKYV